LRTYLRPSLLKCPIFFGGSSYKTGEHPPHVHWRANRERGRAEKFHPDTSLLAHHFSTAIQNSCRGRNLLHLPSVAPVIGGLLPQLKSDRLRRCVDCRAPALFAPDAAPARHFALSYCASNLVRLSDGHGPNPQESELAIPQKTMRVAPNSGSHRTRYFVGMIIPASASLAGTLVLFPALLSHLRQGT
jgi:hypothetical protein